MQFDGRPGVLLVAEGEADVLEARRDAEAAPLAPLAAARRGDPALLAPLPADGLRRFDERLLDAACVVRQRASPGHRIATVDEVAQAELDRVHPQRLGQLVHLRLGDEVALRRAESTEGPAGDVVRVGGEDVGLHVGDAVGAVDGQQQVAHHLVRRVDVGPRIGDDLRLGGDQSPVLRRRPLGVDEGAVPLVMAEDGLLAAPDDLHRALQLPGGQRQDDLHRDILTPAESAADGRVEDAHLLLRQAERVRHLMALLVRPLPAREHGDAPLLVEEGQPRLRLEVGMLLPRNLVVRLDDDVGLGEGGLHVAAADTVPRDEVPLEDQFRMDGDRRVGRVEVRGFGLERLARIVDDRQVLEGDLEPLHALFGGGLRLRDDGGDLIADEAHDVGTRSIAAGAAEDGLVGVLQAVLVDRHVGGGEDGDDAGDGQRLLRLDAQDAGVRTLGEAQFHIELTFHIQVLRVAGLAGDFLTCIHAG